MRYLCLVAFDTSQIERMAPADWQAIVSDSAEYDRKLQRDGVYVHAEALQSSKTAVTVRRPETEDILITEGPFAELKEQVAGFILIDVPSLEDAIAVAGGIPLARIGSVEVRPVL
jgi:hypothetical protein